MKFGREEKKKTWNPLCTFEIILSVMQQYIDVFFTFVKWLQEGLEEEETAKWRVNKFVERQQKLGQKMLSFFILATRKGS